jgi:hypothetical protein
MTRLLNSWRAVRWFAFFFSFGIDFYIFHISDPFTPLSFMTSGIAAAILFLFFFEVARAMKGRGRIRRALDDHEYVIYQVGRHMLALMRKVRADKLAYTAIWFPIWIAIFGSGAIVWAATQEVLGAPPQFGMPWLTLAQYACASFLPLLIAIPFALEHVSEWTSHQYVLAVDDKSHDPRLLIHAGVFDYDLETVAIERTVTTHVYQAWWQVFLGIGNVELRETAGGEGETLLDVWKPRVLEKKIRVAVKESRRRHRTSE